MLYRGLAMLLRKEEVWTGQAGIRLGEDKVSEDEPRGLDARGVSGERGCKQADRFCRASAGDQCRGSGVPVYKEPTPISKMQALFLGFLEVRDGAVVPFSHKR